MSLYGVTRPQWVKMKICSSILLSIFYKSHHQCFMQWVGTDFTSSPTQANNHQDLPHNLQSINTDVLFMKKQLIWLFESRKSVRYWWSYTSFAPECKEWQSLQIAPSRVYPKKSTTRPIWLNGLYYNLTHPINLMRVVLDWIYTSWKEALRFSIMLYLCLYIYYGNSPVCMPNKHCFNVETGLIP